MWRMSPQAAAAGDALVGQQRSSGEQAFARVRLRVPRAWQQGTTVASGAGWFEQFLRGFGDRRGPCDADTALDIEIGVSHTSAMRLLTEPAQRAQARWPTRRTAWQFESPGEHRVLSCGSCGARLPDRKSTKPSASSGGSRRPQLIAMYSRRSSFSSRSRIGVGGAARSRAGRPLRSLA